MKKHFFFFIMKSFIELMRAENFAFLWFASEDIQKSKIISFTYFVDKKKFHKVQIWWVKRSLRPENCVKDYENCVEILWIKKMSSLNPNDDASGNSERDWEIFDILCRTEKVCEKLMKEILLIFKIRLRNNFGVV